MSKPERSALVVMACCVLHNMAKANGVELDINEVELQDQLRRVASAETGPEEVAPAPRGTYLEGVRHRNEIVEYFFGGN